MTAKEIYQSVKKYEDSAERAARIIGMMSCSFDQAKQIAASVSKRLGKEITLMVPPTNPEPVSEPATEAPAEQEEVK